MRLPYRSDIVGLIVGATRSVLGHPQCGGTQERSKGAAAGYAPEDRPFDRSWMDNQNHGVCHFRPGVRPDAALPFVPS